MQHDRGQLYCYSWEACGQDPQPGSPTTLPRSVPERSPREEWEGPMAGKETSLRVVLR